MQQMDFLGVGEPMVREVLFFALLPESGSAQRLAALGSELARRHAPHARRHRPERLHISLLGFRAEPRRRRAAEGLALAMGAAVAGHAFDVTHLMALSFQGGRSKPLVLSCGTGAAAGVTGLRDRLLQAAEDLGCSLPAAPASCPI